MPSHAGRLELSDTIARRYSAFALLTSPEQYAALPARLQQPQAVSAEQLLVHPLHLLGLLLMSRFAGQLDVPMNVLVSICGVWVCFQGFLRFLQRA